MSPNTMIVAIVPAANRADTVGATVEALRGIPDIDEVLVVDDGSTDDTAGTAAAAGAAVLVLSRNEGKGGAIAAGVSARSDADAYLLVDADLGASARNTGALLASVANGSADLVVGVPAPSGIRGGFGWVRGLAGWGISRATGQSSRAPLSGQRAVRGEVLRSLELGHRFGLETAMTIDALRARARVEEVEIEVDHRQPGRSPAGFLHRAGQGIDILRTLWPRLTTGRQRLALMLAAFFLASVLALWSSGRAEPASASLGAKPRRVLVFGMPGLTLEELDSLPNLAALRDRGAVAATSVRTLSGRPSTVEGYATLGAGSRARADERGGYAFAASAVVEGTTARDALARRSGVVVEGEILVVGAPSVVRQPQSRYVPSTPGALGEALRANGKIAAVVGNADQGYLPGRRAKVMRPAAAALMDRGGGIDLGRVDGGLLIDDPVWPFARRADPNKILAAVRDASEADVVVVDAGDLDRAMAFASAATPDQAETARRRALVATDALLGRLVAQVGGRTLVIVVSPRPPEREWRLTPTVVAGPGVASGSALHSASTRRRNLVTLTDVAPTILEGIGVPTPVGMIGHALRFRPGPVTTSDLSRLDRDAAFREHVYLPLTIWYIVLQAAVYLVALIAFTRLGGARGLGARSLELAVLAVAAHPVGTFLHRAIPGIAILDWASIPVLVGIDVAVAALALRARRYALSPLSWILGATVAILAVDVATGARLQTSSILGYSLHTAARFTGFGNTAFATLAVSAVLLGALHVHHSPRRREALLATALLFAFVVLIDGAPTLGSDVGGVLTLVPVMALTLLVLAGRRVSVVRVFLAGALAGLAVLVVAVIDVLRPEPSRTHLGRLVTDIYARGAAPLTEVISRKVATNFRTWSSPWTWAILVISIYMVVMLVWASGWTRLLPARSALRAGAVGALAAGLLGYVLNDSGVVVTALVFVELGPFLTLLALDQGRAPPVLLVAGSEGS